MSNTALSTLQQVITVVLTVMGVVIALRPPQKGTWKEYLTIGLIVVLGGVGVYATYVQGSRLDVASQEQQKQLNVIQKNTEQPPKVEVNIPPSSVPKQRAIMALAKKTDADGIVIFQDPQRSDGWLINAGCKNVGTVTAKRVRCSGDAKLIPASGGMTTKEILRENWNEIIKKLPSEKSSSFVDLEPNMVTWGTLSLEILAPNPDLNSGSKIIMVGGLMFYSDEAGSHKKEFCRLAQPPFNPSNTIWQYCGIGHNTEIY